MFCLFYAICFKLFKPTFNYLSVAQSAGTVEYADCISAKE